MSFQSPAEGGCGRQPSFQSHRATLESSRLHSPRVAMGSNVGGLIVGTQRFLPTRMLTTRGTGSAGSTPELTLDAAFFGIKAYAALGQAHCPMRRCLQLLRCRPDVFAPRSLSSQRSAARICGSTQDLADSIRESVEGVGVAMKTYLSRGRRYAAKTVLRLPDLGWLKSRSCAPRNAGPAR
jgi:hypothetical protein